MAGRCYLSKPAYRFFTNERETPANSDAFEFDEDDMWNSNPDHVWNSNPVAPETRTEFKKQIPSSRITKKSSKKNENNDRTAASSLPVNIPDWSKILSKDYRDSGSRELDDGDDVDENGEDIRIPPHEFLAKQIASTRIASFSVHEGIGRTLKGRDLSRVRDAIWQKTGFED